MMNLRMIGLTDDEPDLGVTVLIRFTYNELLQKVFGI